MTPVFNTELSFKKGKTYIMGKWTRVLYIRKNQSTYNHTVALESFHFKAVHLKQHV